MRTASAILLALLAFAAFGDDRQEYNRRAAAADQAAFQQLDLNRDGRLTRDEVAADVGFAPRFNDIDINRDGVVTREEMQRYLERTYGVSS